MPRLNSYGSVLGGAGNVVTIDGVVYASAGTSASWLTDDTIICQCADDAWRVSICKIGQPGQWAAYDARGCTNLTAGGGLWQAYLAGAECFGEYGSKPGYSVGQVDGDGRGYAGPAGEINLIPTSGLGIEIHSRSHGVYAIPFGPAHNVQVLGPTSALWKDDAGTFHTHGLPGPAQASPGGSPRRCVLPDGSAWIVYASDAYGLIAHPWEDASQGVVLAPPGTFAFYPDARVVGHTIVACWSSGAAELAHELVVVRDVLALPRVPFAMTPTPIPPNPEPPNPEPGPEPPEPEPPMSLVYDFSQCQAYADQRWPQMPHSVGHEQSANFATILYELRHQHGHPFEMFLKPSGQNWLGWDGQYYSEDTAVLRLPDGSVWQKDCIVACGDPSAYISFGRAEDWAPPNPASDADKCVPPPTPPATTPPEPPQPTLPVGSGYLRTEFGDHWHAKRKTGELHRGDAQLLTLTDEGEGRVSIRLAGSGKYVCADPGMADAPLYANRDEVGPWERFFVERRDDGLWRFKAESSGYYVCAEDTGKVVCNRATAGGWESFVFEPD